MVIRIFFKQNNSWFKSTSVKISVESLKSYQRKTEKIQLFHSTLWHIFTISTSIGSAPSVSKIFVAYKCPLCEAM